MGSSTSKETAQAAPRVDPSVLAAIKRPKEPSSLDQLPERVRQKSPAELRRMLGAIGTEEESEKARAELFDYHMQKLANSALTRRDRGLHFQHATTGEARAYKTPTKMYGGNFYKFTNIFEEWYSGVDQGIRKWERREMVRRFKETGEEVGLWGNEYGAKIAEYFPERMGQNMTEPPPYYDVWTQKDRDAWVNYQSVKLGPKRRARVEGTLAVFAIAPFLFFRYRKVLPPGWFTPSLTNWLLHMPLVTLLFFPGSVFVRRRKNAYQAMDSLLNGQGTFLYAHSRLLYDNMAYPEYVHNRRPLFHLERDQWDGFVMGHSPQSIGEGTFAADKYPFSKKDPNEMVATLLPTPWDTTIPFDERVRAWKKPFYQFWGYGFWWEKEGSLHDTPVAGWKKTLLQSTFFPVASPGAQEQEQKMSLPLPSVTKEEV